MHCLVNMGYRTQKDLRNSETHMLHETHEMISFPFVAFEVSLLRLKSTEKFFY